MRNQYEQLILIANSIGAYFSMHALSDIQIDKAFLISPIADMEQLILNMMKRANVMEQELQECREIPTSFGEVLSWEYLNYVRNHPIVWNTPTRILYGEKDTMTSLETITRLSGQTGAELTVMQGGEHWFHTEEQMRFLDAWITMT